MTAKEYLSQARRLDGQINSDIREITRLREIAKNISSSSWSEKMQASHNTEAPFVRSLEEIMELEETVKNEISKLISLKKQIRTVVEAVSDTDERLVLRYRYIHNFTWKQIGDELNADEKTIRRWHSKALSKLELPKNPILIQNTP